MCVLSDVVLSGLSLTSTKSPLPNPMFATNGERSKMMLVERYSLLRLVITDNAEMSDIALSKRVSPVRLVITDNAEMSDIALSARNNSLRLVKPDSADTSADTSVMAVL